MSGKICFEAVIRKHGSAHNHHMRPKIWISLKFHARSIWELPRAGNQARASKMIAKSSQNHPKFEKLENREKSQEMTCMSDFSTLKMKFRSADAANQLCAVRGVRLEWLVELICPKVRAQSVIRRRSKASGAKHSLKILALGTDLLRFWRFSTWT